MASRKVYECMDLAGAEPFDLEEVSSHDPDMRRPYKSKRLMDWRRVLMTTIKRYHERCGLSDLLKAHETLGRFEKTRIQRSK